VNPNTATSYSVIVSNGNCSDSVSTSVTVKPSPTANIASSIAVPITYGQNATLTANGGVTYVWTGGENGSIITVTPMSTTVYCVTATDSNNCSDTACVTVDFYDMCASGIYLPNAFSPNNDGENDSLQLYYENSMCVTSLHIVIYERFGEKVFESNDPAFKWNGVYSNLFFQKDRQAGSEVFMYYLDVKLIDGKEISKKGNITLLR
jgi:gliding motility-associated-like protein